MAVRPDLRPRAATALRALLCCALASAAASSCGDGTRFFDQFDGPVDVAYLPPGTFFEVPVAFVSNFRSGRVGKLDLKRTDVLVEDGAAPWLPGPDIAFGREHSLGELVLAVGPDTVDVWVADDFEGQLLRAPYITGLDADANPVWSRPALDEPRFYAADGTSVEAGTTELRGLRLQEGRATSERWTFTWTGSQYEALGTASGLQTNRVVPGTPFHTDNVEISFTLALGGSEPELESWFEIDVESGIDSADAGGLVTDMVAAPDGDWIFVSVIPDTGPGFVSTWDAQAFVELDRLELAPGSAPERLALGRDDGVLWVADSAVLPSGGRVFRIDYMLGDLQTLAATELPVPEPAFEVAEGRDPDVPLLFVSAAYSDAVWALDPLTAEVRDTNPVTPEADPTHVRNIISGMAASMRPVETVELDEDGTREERYGIFVTTFGGELYFIDAGTGCQVFGTPARAYADFSAPNAASSLFSDVGYESSPQLLFDAGGESLVSTHPCGGVTRTEIWTLTFSESQQSYRVEGSQTGEQLGRLYEGERYLSDRGEISLLILPGTLPTTDGDEWRFSVNDGVTPIQLQELPGDPMIYTELYDDRTGDWFHVREREVAVIPHTANDIVLWVDLQGQGDGGIRAFQ